MFLFKKWVVNDLTAQNFLREHNGLNFMLNRLFQEKQKPASPPELKDAKRGDQAEAEDVSSDETDYSAHDEDAKQGEASHLGAKKKTDAFIDEKTGSQSLSKK